MRVLNFALAFSGLSRDVLRMDPPDAWMRETSSMVRGMNMSLCPSKSALKPPLIPTTFFPELMASMVAALMTPLMPGAGPPPTIIPMVSAFMVYIVHLSIFLCKGFCTILFPVSGPR